MSESEDEKNILAFLKESENKGKSFNFSEIGRKIDRAPPTIKRAVERLEKSGLVRIDNKKSMKLVSLRDKT